jgi:hypothetical protein
MLVGSNRLEKNARNNIKMKSDFCFLSKKSNPTSQFCVSRRTLMENRTLRSLLTLFLHWYQYGNIDELNLFVLLLQDKVHENKVRKHLW